MTARGAGVLMRHRRAVARCSPEHAGIGLFIFVFVHLAVSGCLSDLPTEIEILGLDF